MKLKFNNTTPQCHPGSLEDPSLVGLFEFPVSDIFIEDYGEL